MELRDSTIRSAAGAAGRIVVLLCLSGCCQLQGHRTPEGVTRWQDPRPPTLSLAEKERYYQSRLESLYQTPEGLLRYRRNFDATADDSYGSFPDGCFHTGVYLASQALRFAATRTPEARAQVLLALNGLRLLMEVTGKGGLLARHFTPAGTVQGENWKASPTHPRYIWRSDVSKDQYAGFACGIGVTLAVVDDVVVRAEAAALAAAAADHLIENDGYIVDVDGEVTTHGNLRGRIWGVPIGINALISLAIAKAAAEGTGASEHRAFYRRLVDEGYPEIAYWAYFALFGVGHRVNDNMGYLALYPVLLLEKDPLVVADLHASERRTWAHVREEFNPFFAGVHAALVEEPTAFAAAAGAADGARHQVRRALFEFPDNKVEWPVDLTREPFDFPRAFLNSRKCRPRSTRAVPLYLRPRHSNMWTADPRTLVGNLRSSGRVETAGADYLLAYWMARYHGIVDASE